MRYSSRRRLYVFCKKLFILSILSVCCATLYNLICFDGNCKDSEVSNADWSSLDDVVAEAGKMSVKNNNQYKIPFHSLSTTSETEPRKKKLDVVKKMRSLNLTSLDLCPREQVFVSKATLLAGRREIQRTANKRFLSVGVPSITRKSTSYLKKTLTSIFKAVNHEEEHHIMVVVFLADFDDTAKEKQLKETSNEFRNYVAKGMLQIIQAPVDFYEPLRDLHRSLGDDMDRVMWRSKQALDYSFLMCYCSSLSRFYLQLEDDVLASPSFVSKVVDFVRSCKHKWFALDVADLGFIGKLYPAHEVQNLASYLHLFFNDMPVDWLEPKWREFKGQFPSKKDRRAASLFQHIGLYSSFRPKESQGPNTLKEWYFDKFDQKYRGLNPAAEISSDLVSHVGQVSDAYTRGDGYFWGSCGSAGTKIYHILLKKATRLKRIAVESGTNFAPRDYILKGTLEVGTNVDDFNPKQCKNYSSLGEFRFGQIDVTCNDRLVKCVRINIWYQGRWIVIREVNIWST